MLHYCNAHLDGEKEDDTFQAFAVLGIALIAMGEDIGAEMALRSLNHLVKKKKKKNYFLNYFKPFFFFRCIMENWSREELSL